MGGTNINSNKIKAITVKIQDVKVNEIKVFNNKIRNLDTHLWTSYIIIKNTQSLGMKGGKHLKYL